MTSSIPVVVRRIIVWVAISATGLLSAVGAYPIVSADLENKSWITGVIQRHFAATEGLPFIAGLAFLLVITFEARFDAIEMEFFGVVKLKGASGPIVLWALCFLTMAASLKMLW